MRQTLLTALFALCFLISWGQTTTLTGKVFSATDSTALPGATISIFDTYIATACDKDGSFRLANVPQGPCSLVVSFVGFHELVSPFDAAGVSMELGNIMLYESSIGMDEITVTAIVPLVVQIGDTTQYNADALKVGDGSDADALISKIPGVTIEDGKIEAQGQQIMKVYVDGEPFFFDDPIAALKALPADIVQKIQFFDDASDQAKFTGFDDGERVRAINIVTKGKMKNTTLFKVEGAGGSDLIEDPIARYLFGTSLSYFTKKHRFTFTGLSNNINTSNFSQAENSTVDDNGNTINQPSGVRTTHNYGLNYSFSYKNFKLTANYTYNDNTTSAIRDNLTIYTGTMGKTSGREDRSLSDSYSWSKSHRVNLRAEWKFTKRDTFVWSPQFSTSTSGSDQINKILYIANGDSSERRLYWTKSGNDRYSISGNALIAHKFSTPGRSLSLNFNYDISETDGLSFRNTLYNDSYNKSTKKWNVGNPVPPRRTKTDNWSNVMRLKLSYTQPLGKRHNISFNLLSNTNQGTNNRQVYDFRDVDYDYTGKLEKQSSFFDRDYNSYGGNISYLYLDSLFRINLGVDYMRMDQKQDQFEPKPLLVKQKFDNFQPLASLRYTFKQGTFIRFEYSGKTVLPNILDMDGVLNDNSPNNLRLGNPNLKPGYEHNALFFFTRANTEKSRNFSFTLSARMISNYITTKTTMPGDTVYLPNGDKYPTSNPDVALLQEWVNLNGYFSGRVASTYGFAVKPLKSNLNLSAGYSYIRNPSIYGTLNYSNIHTTNLRVGLTSNISKNIDFNAYYNASYKYTSSTRRKNTMYYQHTLHFGTSLVFLKGFVFTASFNWRFYDNKSSKYYYDYIYVEDFDFVTRHELARNAGEDYADGNLSLDVSIGKKFLPKKNLEIRIQASDLFNQNGSIQHTVRNNYTEDIRTNTLGRNIMLRASYRFNSLSHGKSAQQSSSQNRQIPGQSQSGKTWQGQNGQSKNNSTTNGTSGSATKNGTSGQNNNSSIRQGSSASGNTGARTGSNSGSYSNSGSGAKSGSTSGGNKR